MSSKSPLPTLTPRPMLAASMLCRREIVRFLRQRNRVIGAVGQPILFWLLFGLGLDRSFRLGEAEQSFQQYYIPGTMALILLFTAIFATISIIEDRREGFLQGVLVAPIPRWSMVLGKVLGGSLLALFQSLIFLAIALLFQQVSIGVTQFFAIALLLFVVALGLTSMGVVIAWRMESTQGFHAIMNLLLMPMWLLSGAFFPIPGVDSSGGQIGLHWVMRANPMTYSVAGLRHLMNLHVTPTIGNAGEFWTPTLSSCWLITLLFVVTAFAAAWMISKQRITGDLL